LGVIEVRAGRDQRHLAMAIPASTANPRADDSAYQSSFIQNFT
jgi:hypothetical protein